MGVATRVQAPSLGLALGVSAGVALTVWMFLSENMDRPIVVFLLYLGLLDGLLKLRTNSTAVTLVRDVLLYAILLGFLARAALRRQRLRPPPLTGWILAFVIVVIVQLANPADQGLTHSLASAPTAPRVRATVLRRLRADADSQAPAYLLRDPAGDRHGQRCGRHRSS